MIDRTKNNCYNDRKVTIFIKEELAMGNFDDVFEEETHEKANEKRTFGQWVDDNRTRLAQVGIGLLALGVVSRHSAKKTARRLNAQHTEEINLAQGIAYQAGQRDAYRDVAKNRKRHHGNNRPRNN